GSRNPITGIAGCCARAASGHAAAPPINARNSRRFMDTPAPEQHAYGVTAVRALERGGMDAKCDQMLLLLTSALCHERPRASAARPLFSHLIGTREHRCGNIEAKRLGSFEVDRDLNLGRPLETGAAVNPPSAAATRRGSRLATSKIVMMRRLSRPARRRP